MAFYLFVECKLGSEILKGTWYTAPYANYLAIVKIWPTRMHNFIIRK